MTLDRFVGDVQRFAATSWDREAAIRTDAAVGVETAQFDVAWLDRLIAERVLRPPVDLRVMRDGRAITPGEYAHRVAVSHDSVGANGAMVAVPERVVSLVRDGCTLVLQGAHHHDGELNQLCAGLEFDLGHPVGVNAYLSPPASGGAAHFDHHDVLVVQTAGSKRWRLGGPRTDAVSCDDDQPESFEPLEELLLQRGDVLYLPRGIVHEVSTGDVPSLHLTFSIHVRTVAQRLAEEVAAWSSRPELARAWGGPVDRSLSSMQRAVLEALWGDVVERCSGRAVSRRSVRRPGQLTEVVDAPRFSDDQLVAPASLPWEVEPFGGAARVRVGCASVEVPLHAVAALHDAAASGAVRVDALLPDHEPAVGRALARQMLRAGVLRRVDGPR